MIKNFIKVACREGVSNTKRMNSEKFKKWVNAFISKSPFILISSLNNFFEYSDWYKSDCTS